VNPSVSDSASTTTPNEPGDQQESGGHSIPQRRSGHPETTGRHLNNESQLRDRCWVETRSADELADLLYQTAHPIVVAFEDRDCNHCRAQRAMLSLTWDQLSWQVTTLRVDGRRLPEVADHYRILGYPTLLVFSAGQVVDRLPGRRDARSVIDRLSRLTRPTHVGKDNSAPAGPPADTPTAVSPVAS
jgi:thioredoxin-like negative regulator of GroEL